MFKIFLSAVIISFSYTSVGQVAVSTDGSTPHPSAMLEVKSASKGILIPRLTGTQRILINSPAEGLLVYDSTSNRLYMYESNGWRYLATSQHWGRNAGQEYTFNTVDRIGIGTSTPDEKLHITGGNLYLSNADLRQNNGMIQLQNSGVNKGFIDLNGNDIRIGTYSTNNTGQLVLRANGYDGMAIDPAGNVVPLQDIQFKNGTTETGFIQRNGNDLRLGTNSANALGKIVFRTNGGDRVWIDSSGNMSLGTSVPAEGYRLSVKGKIITDEVRVELQSAWPDYVFEKDYSLNTIEGVEKFIDENKHLPGIPSAKNISEHGLQVGDMQKRMMEKIEELTLYIIQMNKKVKELEKEINNNKKP